MWPQFLISRTLSAWSNKPIASSEQRSTGQRWQESAGRATFDAELFKSKIDLLARQYSQGFDEILGQGANERRDEVTRVIANEMDMEVSSYIAKLEDLKAKLKNGSVNQDQDNDGRSNDGPLPGDSPVGIQEELRDFIVKLQLQIRNMEDSNVAFQKRFDDAAARSEERAQEVTYLQKQMEEALESIRKFKDDTMQIPVAPADESVQTGVEDFQTMCAQLEEDFEKFINKYREHRYSLGTVKEELLEAIRALFVKLEVCEQACTPAQVRLGKAVVGLGDKRTRLTLMSRIIEPFQRK